MCESVCKQSSHARNVVCLIKKGFLHEKKTITLQPLTKKLFGEMGGYIRADVLGDGSPWASGISTLQNDVVCVVDGRVLAKQS